jgi:hypothetical protein
MEPSWLVTFSAVGNNGHQQQTLAALTACQTVLSHQLVPKFSWPFGLALQHFAHRVHAMLAGTEHLDVRDDLRTLVAVAAVSVYAVVDHLHLTHALHLCSNKLVSFFLGTVLVQTDHHCSPLLVN